MIKTGYGRDLEGGLEIGEVLGDLALLAFRSHSEFQFVCVIIILF